MTFFPLRLLRSLRCFLKNLHEWQKFYTTAGRTGHAKYQLWRTFLFKFLYDLSEYISVLVKVLRYRCCAFNFNFNFNKVQICQDSL